MAVATAVAGKAAESLTGQAGQAIAAIRRKIRDRFHGGEVPALDAARDDPSAAARLARFLDAEFAADPAFRDEIRALWLQAAPAATDDAVSNVFYGTADKVVQLRDVHGDLNISLPACGRHSVRRCNRCSPCRSRKGKWASHRSFSVCMGRVRGRQRSSPMAPPPLK
jgi:hypothetical protein